MAAEKSINQEKQQKINRTLVLRLVRQEKLASRAEIAKLSGLQRATITNIVKELIELGIVVEDGLLSGDIHRNPNQRRKIWCCRRDGYKGVFWSESDWTFRRNT